MAGLVPAISIQLAMPCLIVVIAGSSPAMTT
jgi:hypothetical protein